MEGFLDFCTQAVAQSLMDGTPLPDCTPSSSGGGMLQTGQTTAYGAGSDGDLQNGTARSFTDNGDGTITDDATGLMWEKKSDDGGIHDKDNTYTWNDFGTSMSNGTMVLEFLYTLNNGCSIAATPCSSNADCPGPGDLCGFAGYRDWRIPNQHELESLRNFQTASPQSTRSSTIHAPEVAR